MNWDACGKIRFMQSPKTTPVGHGFAVLDSDGFFRLVHEGRRTGVHFWESGLIGSGH
jgi:hypothetical protein